LICGYRVMKTLRIAGGGEQQFMIVRSPNMARDRISIA
jgi:hypothetical protein